MKIPKMFFMLLIAVFVIGCQSTFGPKLGMTENQWLHTTLIADVVYMEGNVKAYRSNRAYYYFVDGVLEKIDQGMIPPQKILMEVKSDRTISVDSKSDKYSELRKLDQLRKDGIITEDEFEVEKKKILN
jgi:hypothetical protein